MKTGRKFAAVLILTSMLLLVCSTAWAANKATVWQFPEQLTIPESGFTLEVPDNVYNTYVKIEMLPLESSSFPASDAIYITRAVDVIMSAYHDERVHSLIKPVRLVFNFDEIDFKRASNMDTSLPLGRFKVGYWNQTKKEWKQLDSTIYWNGTQGVIEAESALGDGKYALIWSNEANPVLSPYANDEIRVMVNYNVLHPLEPAYIKAGRTMVPLKVIAEAMGVRVYWDASERRIDLIDNSKTVKLWIGSFEAQNGKETITISTPPEIVNSTTFVPLGFVGESLGATINWDQATRTAKLIKKS